MSRSGAPGNRGRRFVARGAAGIAAAVLVLLSGTAAAAGTGSSGPPYHLSFLSGSTTRYLDGCAGARYTHAPAFHGRTGRYRIGEFANATTCPAQGPIGYNESDAFLSAFLEFEIPISIAKNGSYSIRQNWTFAIENTLSYSVGGCPNSTLHVAPPATGVSFCAAEVQYFVQLSSTLVSTATDGMVGSSDFEETTNLGWANYTSCGPIGPGPAWGCSTTTGPFNSSERSGVGAAVPGGFQWNGTTALSLWTNASGLRQGGGYALQVDLTLGLSASAGASNIARAWPAQSHGSLRLARPGTLAALDSLWVR